MVAPGAAAAPTTSAVASSASTSTRARSRTSTPRYDGHPSPRARTTSCSTPHGGFYFTDLGKSRGPRGRQGAASTTPRPTARRSRELVYGARPRQRHRPLARRDSALRRRDDHRAHVDLGLAVAGVVGTGGPHRSARARCCYSFDGFQLLDSMAVDSAGNICVATLVTGAVSVVSPDGELLDQFAVPGARPLRDQRLLRRARPHHGLRHVVRSGEALRDGLGAARPSAPVQPLRAGARAQTLGVLAAESEAAARAAAKSGGRFSRKAWTASRCSGVV